MDEHVNLMVGIGTIVTAVNAGLVFVNQLMIQNAIKANNEVLIDKINGTYVKKEVCLLAHTELGRRITHAETLLEEE